MTFSRVTSFANGYIIIIIWVLGLPRLSVFSLFFNLCHYLSKGSLNLYCVLSLQHHATQKRVI